LPVRSKTGNILAETLVSFFAHNESNTLGSDIQIKSNQFNDKNVTATKHYTLLVEMQQSARK